MTNPDHILATYLLETPYPLDQTLEVLQSSFVATVSPLIDKGRENRFTAHIRDVQPLDPADRPGLSGKYGEGPRTAVYRRAMVRVAIPVSVSGVNLLNTITALLGNVFELNEVSGLRLVDVDFPEVFAGAYPGPQFGIEGTRRLIGEAKGVLVGSIIKPSVGLMPEQTAEIVCELAEAGIDFIKDDELMTSPPYSPLEKRVEVVMRVINEIADRTGKQAMFAFNISASDIDTMLRGHDTVLKHGGTCIMASINHVGFAGMLKLRHHSQLPIHAHRNGWGMLTRAAALGMDFRAYRKLWGLAGVDHLHVNGIRNKFWEPDDSVVRSIEACLTPLFGKPVMPVISSGQWGGQAPDTYKRTHTTDLLYLAGGGIQAHPLGPASGVLALRQAWEAAVEGIPLDDYARTHAELEHAIAMFAKRTH